MSFLEKKGGSFRVRAPIETGGESERRRPFRIREKEREREGEKGKGLIGAERVFAYLMLVNCTHMYFLRFEH